MKNGLCSTMNNRLYILGINKSHPSKVRKAADQLKTFSDADIKEKQALLAFGPADLVFALRVKKYDVVGRLPHIPEIRDTKYHLLYEWIRDDRKIPDGETSGPLVVYTFLKLNPSLYYRNIPNLSKRTPEKEIAEKLFEEKLAWRKVFRGTKFDWCRLLGSHGWAEYLLISESTSVTRVLNSLKELCNLTIGELGYTNNESSEEPVLIDCSSHVTISDNMWNSFLEEKESSTHRILDEDNRDLESKILISVKPTFQKSLIDSFYDKLPLETDQQRCSSIFGKCDLMIHLPVFNGKPLTFCNTMKGMVNLFASEEHIPSHNFSVTRFFPNKEKPIETKNPSPPYYSPPELEKLKIEQYIEGEEYKKLLPLLLGKELLLLIKKVIERYTNLRKNVKTFEYLFGMENTIEWMFILLKKVKSFYDHGKLEEIPKIQDDLYKHVRFCEILIRQATQGIYGFEEDYVGGREFRGGLQTLQKAINSINYEIESISEDCFGLPYFVSVLFSNDAKMSFDEQNQIVRLPVTYSLDVYSVGALYHEVAGHAFFSIVEKSKPLPEIQKTDKIRMIEVLKKSYPREDEHTIQEDVLPGYMQLITECQMDLLALIIGFHFDLSSYVEALLHEYFSYRITGILESTSNQQAKRNRREQDENMLFRVIYLNEFMHWAKEGFDNGQVLNLSGAHTSKGNLIEVRTRYKKLLKHLSSHQTDKKIGKKIEDLLKISFPTKQHKVTRDRVNEITKWIQQKLITKVYPQSDFSKFNEDEYRMDDDGLNFKNEELYLQALQRSEKLAKTHKIVNIDPNNNLFLEVPEDFGPSQILVAFRRLLRNIDQTFNNEEDLRMVARNRAWIETCQLLSNYARNYEKRKMLSA